MIDRFMKSAHCISLIVLSFLGGKDFCLHALDKVRDPEYLKTCYQCIKEQDTKEVALVAIYMGGDLKRSIDRETARRGFLDWKSDANYLSSDDFLKKALSPEGLSECVADFDLWSKVSYESGVFSQSWYKREGTEAAEVLKNMHLTYEGWLNTYPGTTFIAPCISQLTDLCDITAKDSSMDLEYKD